MPIFAVFNYSYNVGFICVRLWYHRGSINMEIIDLHFCLKIVNMTSEIQSDEVLNCHQFGMSFPLNIFS